MVIGATASQKAISATEAGRIVADSVCGRLSESCGITSRGKGAALKYEMTVAAIDVTPQTADRQIHISPLRERTTATAGIKPRSRSVRSPVITPPISAAVETIDFPHLLAVILVISSCTVSHPSRRIT